VRAAGRRRLAALAALAVAGVAAFGGISDARRATKHVDIGDNYYLPEKVRVHKGDKVRWVYSLDLGDMHDVYLKRAPDGVRKARYRSPTLLPNDAFARRFKKRGRYHFICTFHSQEMQMDVRVRR
jgi:plastocyanin